MSTCGQQSPDLVDWDRNLGKKWYQISSKKLSPFLVGHLLDFWPHNNNLLFVPQGFEKLHRSSPLRLIARDIGKKLFYRVLGNVTQKKKSPYGDLCNITITFGRPDCIIDSETPWLPQFYTNESNGTKFSACFYIGMGLRDFFARNSLGENGYFIGFWDFRPHFKLILHSSKWILCPQKVWKLFIYVLGSIQHNL